MLRSPRVLLVYPVPFAALDAYGMPSAAVRFDPPTGRRNEVHFIGCTRHNALIERRKRAEGRQSLYATSFRYDLVPHRITHTDYHVQRIRHGELIPADAATAKIAGVPFVPPTTAFERARYGAIARWEQQYGEPPPTDQWPEMRLALPDDDTPSTAPAHGASMRARGAQPAVGPAAPVPAPAPVAPAAAPVLEGAAPGDEVGRVVPPPTAFAGMPLPRGVADEPLPTPKPAPLAPGPAVEELPPAPIPEGKAT